MKKNKLLIALAIAASSGVAMADEDKGLITVLG